MNMSKRSIFACLQENSRVFVYAYSHRHRFTRLLFYHTARNNTRLSLVWNPYNPVYIHLVTLLQEHVDKIRGLAMNLYKLLIVLLRGMQFCTLLIFGVALFLVGRMLKQGIIISLWNRHSQRMWHSIEAIGDHDLLSVLLPEESFTV